MKSMLETSFYLLLLTVICYMGIDFVQMNQKVSKVNEVQQYVKDYIEIHGVHQPDGSLDENTLLSVEKIAEENHLKFSYDIISQTNQYVYYNFKLEYKLAASLFQLEKTHPCKGIARTALDERSTDV